jgi:hypothetical protein
MNNRNICFSQVVWSVAAIPARNLAVDLTAEGSLLCKTVIINIGGVWSHTRNAAVIAVPGIYYTVVTMDISSYSHFTGSCWLKVNGENVFETKPTKSSNGGQTRNNGAVIRLGVGDNVSMTMEPLLLISDFYYVSSNATASFFGILLSPDNYT